jgi:hypothetical protein
VRKEREVSAVAEEEQVSTVGQVADRIPRDRPLGVIHSGGRYLFGFGPNSYAIWDAASEGAPVEEFPATKQGRLDGWHRYVELEPEAQKIPPEQSPVREEVEEIEARSRRGGILVGGGVALLLIVGLIVFLTTRSKETGPGGTTAGSGGGPTTTHVDVTGQFNVSEDLTQKSFTPPKGLSGVHIKGSWEGATMKLALDFENPSPGEYTTSQFPFRRLDVSFAAPDGAELQLTSLQGDCKVKLNKADEQSVSGSFDCTGVTPTGSDQTVDIKGTFFAKP